MDDDAAVLVSAITDVGQWRWWASEFPKLFQLEFGGVQIYERPADPTRPPSSMLALRFRNPALVAFMRRTDSPNIPADWHTKLHDDAIEPFPMSGDAFAFEDDDAIRKIVSERTSEVEVHRGEGSTAVRVAFWAGPVGVHVEAAELELVTLNGKITSQELVELHHAWWDYWKDYWKKRGTPEALPKSYACEVTIPLKAE